MTFIPDFVVSNSNGQFLGRNTKSGRNQLRCVWVRNRSDAEHFSRWIEADNWRMSLPFASQDRANITDQNGDIWSPERAQLTKVFHSRSAQPESN